MSKSKVEKRINNKIKSLNKNLRNDIFKDRFWVRQFKKSKIDGVDYFMFELIDELQPKRNYIIPKWYSFSVADVFIEMNNFIVSSDFWEKNF